MSRRRVNGQTTTTPEILEFITQQIQIVLCARKDVIPILIVLLLNVEVHQTPTVHGGHQENVPGNICIHIKEPTHATKVEHTYHQCIILCIIINVHVQ